MRTSMVLLALSLACTRPSPSTKVESRSEPERAPIEALGEGEAVAYFAGGCFWGVEYWLERLPGVLSVESGYMGGGLESPTYETLEGSGHLESVRVRFDPQRISFEAITKRFFEIHDPTQADGQGPDIGHQYRSAVFPVDAEQDAIVRELIERLRARGHAVVTEVRPAATFWPAETYHQDYYDKADSTPYCHMPVDRFGE